AVALGLALARPLMRGSGGDAPKRADFDAAIYRDQLAEIERDRARGTLSDEQAAAARLEVERRLLATAGAAGRAAEPAQPRPAAAPLLAAAVAVAVPALALALYAWIGAPGLPGQPFAERRIAMGQTAGQAAGQPAMGGDHPGGQAESMDVLTERLAKRLAADPGDPEGWSLLARSYQQLERHRDAVAALERAASISGRDPQYVAALGEARIMAANGTVPPQARAEFDEVLKREPKDPRARFYVALAEAQAGNLQGALDRLVAMAKETPQDAPYLAMLRERIGSLASELKQDPAKLLASLPQSIAPRAQQAPPSPPGAASGTAQERGPSAADVAAAQAMSPEARQQMIRGMVDGLAQRMQDNPSDVEGWLRLMRAYKVLGEDGNAAEAAAKAAAANPAQRIRIAAMAQQLGIGTPLPAQPANPTTAAQPANPATAAKPANPTTAAQPANPTTAAQPPNPAVAAAPAALDAAAIRAGGAVAPERLSALRQKLLIVPDDREALWQVGLAEAGAGNKLAAAELWGRLIAQFPPGSPEHAALRRRLDGLR
ncbi:MAG: c-type cytochrome biogenesis protein CcmI, partial [Rhodospirillales bacterium]